MRKKRIFIPLIVLIVFVLSFSLFTYADAYQQLKVYINDNLIKGDAKTINGEVYIPLSAIKENMGVSVETSKDSGTVHISTPDSNLNSIINKISPSVVGVIGNLKRSSESKYYKDSMVFGTGVIIKSNGFIITNAHVVTDMENIMVVLSNSKSYEARLIAIDDKIDLAMIKIDKGELTPVVFGDMSDIKVGESVVAIGTPLSLTLRNSATKGIIGGLNRSIQEDYSFIQSDVAINGGNSGGPLVNMEGKVIGINSIKFTGYGVEGLSFSIPVDTVKYAIDQFKKYGKIRRPYSGITFVEGLAAQYGLPSNEGITISEIDEDSPAEKCGLKVDDMVMAVDGKPMTAIVDFNEEMKNYLPGSSAVLTVMRDEKELKIKIVFGESK